MGLRPPDLGDKQVSATTHLPVAGAVRSADRSSRAAGSCSSLIGWAARRGERPLGGFRSSPRTGLRSGSPPTSLPGKSPPKSLEILLPSSPLRVCLCPSHHPRVSFPHLLIFFVPLLKFFQAPSGCSKPLSISGPSGVSGCTENWRTCRPRLRSGWLCLLS